MDILFERLDLSSHETLIFPVTEELKLTPLAETLDKELGGMIARAMETAQFKGKNGKLLNLYTGKASGVKQVMLLGLGKAAELTAIATRNAGGAVINALNGARIEKAALVAEAPAGISFSAAEFAARLAYGLQLKSYRFDKYFTTKTEEEKPTLQQVTLLVADESAVTAAYAPLASVAQGVFTVRDLATEPANVIHPESLAAYCKELAKDGIEVEVLNEDAMRKLGMHSLLGVGQGSERESHAVVMRWNGGKEGDAPLAFIGKGVTFDTGGISIKPAAGMEEMKYDMAGAATVIGLMKSLARRKAKANVVGVIGLVENMPDGNAQRPGDVVTSMSGQTIEVINTDAEGRLVLADILWYTQDRFKPKFMINLATLTGAIIIALGSSRAGLFSNNDELASRITSAAEAVAEPVWRLPLGEEYDKQINSEIADMKNVGEGREAGSITAAQFLQRFVNKTPWAHIDIAGVAWNRKDQPTVPKGASGFGVQLLNQLVQEFYEK